MIRFKWLESVLEAAPSILLTSYTIVLSLFNEQDSPEVIPITWISFLISVSILTHSSISVALVREEVKLKTIVFAYCLLFCDVISSVTIPPMLAYHNGKM